MEGKLRWWGGALVEVVGHRISKTGWGLGRPRKVVLRMVFSDLFFFRNVPTFHPDSD